MAKLISESVEFTGKTTTKKIQTKKFVKSQAKTGTLNKDKFSIFGKVDTDKKRIENAVNETDNDIQTDLREWQKNKKLYKASSIDILNNTDKKDQLYDVLSGNTSNKLHTKKTYEEVKKKKKEHYKKNNLKKVEKVGSTGSKLNVTYSESKIESGERKVTIGRDPTFEDDDPIYEEEEGEEEETLSELNIENENSNSSVVTTTMEGERSSKHSEEKGLMEEERSSKQSEEESRNNQDSVNDIKLRSESNSSHEDPSVIPKTESHETETVESHEKVDFNNQGQVYIHNNDTDVNKPIPEDSNAGPLQTTKQIPLISEDTQQLHDGKENMKEDPDEDNKKNNDNVELKKQKESEKQVEHLRGIKTTSNLSKSTKVSTERENFGNLNDKEVQQNEEKTKKSSKKTGTSLELGPCIEQNLNPKNKFLKVNDQTSKQKNVGLVSKQKELKSDEEKLSKAIERTKQPKVRHQNNEINVVDESTTIKDNDTNKRNLKTEKDVKASDIDSGHSISQNSDAAKYVLLTNDKPYSENIFICNLIAAGNEYENISKQIPSTLSRQIDQSEYRERINCSDQWLYIAHGYEDWDNNDVTSDDVTEDWIRHAEGATHNIYRDNDHNYPRSTAHFKHSMFFVDNLLIELDRYSNRWKSNIKELKD